MLEVIGVMDSLATSNLQQGTDNQACKGVIEVGARAEDSSQSQCKDQLPIAAYSCLQHRQSAHFIVLSNYGLGTHRGDPHRRLTHFLCYPCNSLVRGNQ